MISGRDWDEVWLVACEADRRRKISKSLSFLD
jgi:hypothetical protein